MEIMVCFKSVRKKQRNEQEHVNGIDRMRLINVPTRDCRVTQSKCDPVELRYNSQWKYSVESAYYLRSKIIGKYVNMTIKLIGMILTTIQASSNGNEYIRQ